MSYRDNKIFRYYENLSEPIKASLWFTIASVLQKGIALLSTPIFTRIMTTEQYGTYTLYQSWYSIIFIFATLNLSAGVYNNGITKFENDRNRFTSSIQGLSTTITLGLFLIYIVEITFWNKTLQLSSIFIVAMFIEILFIPAFNFWAAGQRYDYKYKKLIIITIIMALLSPILGITMVFTTQYKAEARVISYVIIQVIIGLIFYIYNLKKGKQFYNKKYWEFALKFNLPLIPHYLSMTVLNQADRIMISNISGTEKAAIYGVTYTLSMVMTIVTTAINNSFVPYTYKSIKSRNFLGIKKNANFLLVLISITCVITMAFGPEIIKIIAPPEYFEARWIVPPVATALFFMFMYPLFCNIEFYFEKTKFIMIASCLGAIINIILNYYLIPIFGYIAAAYTTLLCYILFAITHYVAHRIVLKKELNIKKDIYSIKFFIISSVIMIIIMIVMLYLYNFFAIRYIFVIGLIIILYINRNIVIDKFKELKK